MAVAQNADDNSNKIGSFYALTVDVAAKEYDIKTKKSKVTSILYRGMIILVEDKDSASNNYVVKSWDSESKTIYYLIPAEVLLTKAVQYKPEQGVVLGPLIMPIKLRFPWRNSRTNEFEFSKDVSIGTAIGYRFGISEFNPYYLSPVATIGISDISIDSANTNGMIKKPINVAGFTWSVGVVAEFGKMQFGIFGGADYVSKNSSYHWVNQNTTWISIGIGYQLFSMNGSKQITENWAADKTTKKVSARIARDK